MAFACGFYKTLLMQFATSKLTKFDSCIIIYYFIVCMLKSHASSTLAQDKRYGSHICLLFVEIQPMTRRTQSIPRGDLYFSAIRFMFIITVFEARQTLNSKTLDCFTDMRFKLDN